MANLDNTLFMKHLRMKRQRLQQQQQQQLQAGAMASQAAGDVEAIRSKSFDEGMRAARERGQVAAAQGQEAPNYANRRMQEQAQLGAGQARGQIQQQQRGRLHDLAMQGVKGKQAAHVAAMKELGTQGRFSKQQGTRDRMADISEARLALQRKQYGLAAHKDRTKQVARLATVATGLLKAVPKDIVGRVVEGYEDAADLAHMTSQEAIHALNKALSIDPNRTTALLMSQGVDPRDVQEAAAQSPEGDDTEIGPMTAESLADEILME